MLNKRKVEQLGAPVDLYENPRTAFVAGFLGQTNLLSVNVISHGSDVVKVDFHGVTLALPAQRMAASGTAVEAGVRPEKIQPADRGQAPQGMNAIDGTIIDTSFIGSRPRIIFFVLPILTLANNSLTTGGLEGSYSFSFSFGNYWQVWTEYWPQFLRSFVYAGLATVAAILLSYPLAYTIALKVSARVRPIMLVLVIAPFFTRFLIRTLAWTTVLTSDVRGWPPR